MQNSKFSTKKEDFINFLVNATPEEINKYIIEKGKPRKLIEPMFFFDNNDNKNIPPIPKD